MPDLAITAPDVLLDVLQVLNSCISTGVTPHFVQPQGEISALLPWPQSPWGSSVVSALPVDEFPSWGWRGVAICTLLGQWHIFWHPLADFLVARVFCVLPGQQGRFWHLLMDCQVVRVIHTLQEQQGYSTQGQISQS